jgi:ParB family chromosome partitioning protein
MILQYLPLNQINIADDSYRITFAPRLEELTRSIKTVGLVQPIIVRHTSEGTYQIVSGYKRVLVLKELGRQSLPALVSEPSDMSPTQAFLMNLHDNAITRQLNIIERATALAKLRQFYSMNEEDLVKQFLPIMGDDPSYKILHQLLTLDQLTEPMKHHVVLSDLALSSASRIAEFSASTQQALLGVLSHIKPSTNKLNELLTLIREIAARDGLTVEDILQRYQLLQIVADTSTPAAAKAMALKKTLQGVKFPQLSEKQRRLTELIQGLELPDAARLVADPYFEKQTFKLEYQFNQPEELNELVSKIQDAFEKQRWHQVFEWYQG